MFEHLTDKAIKVIMLSQEETRRLGQNLVGTEQLLLGLLAEGTSIPAKTLNQMGVTLPIVRREVERMIGRGSRFVPSEIPFTPKVKRVFEQSLVEARQFDHSYIGPEHILLALIAEGEGVATRVLKNLGIEPEALRDEVLAQIQGFDVSDQPNGSDQQAVGVGSATRPSMKARTPLLEEFGTNLTQQATDGKLDPVVGRSAEIQRTVQILGRRSKNNPVLVGEPGVGKTAIAEGLAQRIVNQDVPMALWDKQVYGLDMGRLLAGTRYRGDFEERLKGIVAEVKAANNIILVIDELHTLLGAGGVEGGMDAANLLKPALGRGEIQVVGMTTLDEYRKHIERDAALERRFQPVMVGEPSPEEAVEILEGLRVTYEQHHKVKFTDTALQAAVQLSERYISDRYLPDKAIDLIDEAGSRKKLSNGKPNPAQQLKAELRQVTQAKEKAVEVQDFEQAGQLRDQERALEKQLKELQTTPQPQTDWPVVDEEDIAQIVAAWTGITVTQLTESESARLLHLEDILHERVVGQEEAVVAVSRAIRRARVGLKDPKRPIASFLFSGPTGVGKTELTKALAASFFGSEEAMIRLDMSEYMERHTVSKLIGSPPGFVGYDEGGQLTEAVRRRPYTVLLFDEIEKAHPDVFNMLLQILEDGRLTDAKGRTVDFKNTLIILTSNVGSRAIEKGGQGLGFDAVANAQEATYQRMKAAVMEELKQLFRPEFINRLDDIIVFRQLNRSEVTEIADILLRDVSIRLQEQGISLEVTPAFKEQVVKEGYDPRYGARPLRRAIMRLLEDSLAEAMLCGDVMEGDTALVDVNAEGVVQVCKLESKDLVQV